MFYSEVDRIWNPTAVIQDSLLFGWEMNSGIGAMDAEFTQTYNRREKILAHKIRSE